MVTTTPPPPGDPGHHDRTYAAYFARISEGLLSSGSEPVTFERVVRRAVQIVPGCDEGAITVARRRRDPVPAAATTDEVELLEQLLDADGDGPSWSGPDSGMLLSDDLRHEPRWPRWSVAPWNAASAPCSASGCRPRPRRSGRCASTHAARARSPTTRWTSRPSTPRTPRPRSTRPAWSPGCAPLSSHDTRSGVAQGMLAMRYEISHEQAFELLRRYSSRTNTKLRDVARTVVQTRRLPGDDAAPRR